MKIAKGTPRRIIGKIGHVDSTVENELGGIGSMEVWMSTEGEDRHGEVVKSDAFNESFAAEKKAGGKGFPFLVSHMHVLSDGTVPAIGRAMNPVEVPGKGSKATVLFAPESVNRLAPSWLKAFAGGWITDVSVGFLSDEMDHDDDGPLTHTKSELVELSAAAVGSNRGAQAISVTINKSVADGAPPEVVAILKTLAELTALHDKATALVSGAKSHEDAEAGEATEDDDNVFIQVAEKGIEYDGALREIELKHEGEERSVFATVGTPAGTETLQVTFLRFAKTDGWSENSAREWVADVDLDGLVRAALTGDDADNKMCACADVAKTLTAQVAKLTDQVAGLTGIQAATEALTARVAKYLDRAQTGDLNDDNTGDSDAAGDAATTKTLAEIQRDLSEVIESGSPFQANGKAST